MRHKFIFILFFLSFLGINVYSQDDRLVQFSGVIRNLKYEPVENVHIINLRKGTGTTSNRKGMFSFIVEPSDSILFRAIGYKNTLVHIPDSISDTHYPRDVYLLNDTIRLAEVKIFPWKSYEEFKVAFINLELPENDMQRAVRNIEIIKAQLNMDFEPNADLAFKNNTRQQYEKLYYAGQYPSISILNPFNWIKFFEALKAGDFKNDDDD
ncbi:MAG: hypothetical protein ACP5E3_13820 [Bacteroidales bacterium]